MENAIEIAKNEVQSRDSRTQKETMGEEKKLKQNCEIIVWKTPQNPGGFRKVPISDEGIILGYSKGK